MDALWIHDTDPRRLAALTVWIMPERGPSAPFFPPASHHPGPGKQSFQFSQAAGKSQPLANNHPPLAPAAGHLPPLQKAQLGATCAWMMGKGSNLQGGI